MSESVNLPALGESVTEGTVTRWLKSVGDRVEVDEPLLEVSTDKVDTEIPSPVAGVIEEILVAEDETVEVGAALVVIGDGSSAGAAPASPAEDTAAIHESTPQQPTAPAAAPAQAAVPQQQSAPVAAPSQPAPPVPMPAPAAQQPDQAQSSSATPSSPATQSFVVPSGDSAPSESRSRVAAGYVTPIVRKLAHQRGVDLDTVAGSGVGGRIRKQDVLSAQGGTSPVTTPARTMLETSPLRGTSQPMSRLRKVIADRAVASMQATAQLTTVVEVDVTRVASLRNRVKADFLAKTGTKLSFLPFFARAAVEALQAYPVINSTTDGNSIVYPDHENLAIAVDTERGLLTPVVRNAGGLSIAELAGQIANLAGRTRDNQLKPDELAGGTFTLTNTGSRGALFDTPVVFLPQSAILGTGVVVKKPTVVTVDGADAIAIRSTVYLALSYDHRIIDGADAARFLSAMKNRLEEGAFENDLGI